jgi:hypothetical protein
LVIKLLDPASAGRQRQPRTMPLSVATSGPAASALVGGPLSMNTAAQRSDPIVEPHRNDVAMLNQSGRVGRATIRR